MMNNSPRMSWVDTAKGLSIILVVAMYSAYNTGEYTGAVGFLHYFIGFATPFRMPEFFLISGLFLSQVIARPWPRYADRRVIHYFYFYALWAFIMIVLKVGIFARAPADMLRELALAVVEPYGVLWFIYMLAIFSIAAKLLWQLRVPHWVVVPLAAALQMAHIEVFSYMVTQFAALFRLLLCRLCRRAGDPSLRRLGREPCRAGDYWLVRLGARQRAAGLFARLRGHAN